jgi:hypothetical protein
MLRPYIISETNEEAASRNRTEAKTNVVYFNDGCSVKREKLDISAAKTPQTKTKANRCAVKPGGLSGKRKPRITRSSRQLLATSLSAARLLISSPLAFLMSTKDLLGSSLVSRHRQLRDEPWKARASDSKEKVQALAVGITTLGADRAGPILHRPVGRAWKGSSLGSEDQSCLHTYELLNSKLSQPKR